MEGGACWSRGIQSKGCQARAQKNTEDKNPKKEDEQSECIGWYYHMNIITTMRRSSVTGAVAKRPPRHANEDNLDRWRIRDKVQQKGESQGQESGGKQKV